MEDSDKQVFYGTVIWFNNSRGYGFLQQEGGQPDLFLHYSDLTIDGFKSVQKDDKVSYEIGFNNAGREKAINVTVIK
jgi:CspA family cold shock protein